MSGTLRQWLEALGDIFWIRPALLVLGGVVLGELAVLVEQADVVVPWVPDGWIYNGGESGARAMLGAVASSTIGVAGTTFSITVAALSLASGQMGPRLLRNFIRDPGNQYALGIFLGTFAYALVVLRTVRSVDEVAFVPHLAVSGALVLALLCVATLVWFVHHVASGINVETVIDLVHVELDAAIERLCPERAEEEVSAVRPRGEAVTLDGHGYLRAVDVAGLADWAAAQGAVVVLLVKPGDYVFTGAAVAEVEGGRDGAAAARAALALGARQAAAEDLEFAVRQLVEVAVRALSPGINDPFTAMAVLDRLGASLCEVARRQLPGRTVVRGGRVVLFRRVTDYAGLTDAMFHMIRQSAIGSPAVLIRMVEVLGQVTAVEGRAERRMELGRHAALALAAGRVGIADPADLAALQGRAATLARFSAGG